ncbi:hypothetical protein LguiA_004325 [Lonicera macranthoides]
MYHFLKKTTGLPKTSPSFFSNLIDHCLSLKSSDFAKFIHAQLIKLGYNTNTFLGNRCVDLFSKVGTVKDALQAFDEITDKNIISWNICLKVLVQSHDLTSARKVFDEIPERDVVTWNSMISGYASNGYVDCMLELLLEMQNAGIRPSVFTFSILVSCVRCAHTGKQIHGSMIRNGVNLSSVIVGNSLVDMYGKLGLLDYSFGVFLTMEELDIISWNSLISGCCKLGYEELALNQFRAMRATGNLPDEFTVSTITTVCSNLQDLEKGKQILSLCIKSGFNSNSIVSSSVIDLFSKCNRLDYSIRVFGEIDVWDSAVCNSMISSYARHGFEENSLQIFVLTLRKGLRPTEFTLSCVVSCASVFLPIELGCQLHSLVVKVGFESDPIVASSLVEMYSKYGLIDFAMDIFVKMGARDLISWNTMILGFTYNGKVFESLYLFKELLEGGPPPDQITLTGVLLACNYGGFVNEGMAIFSSMEKEYGIIPINEHYACMVDMMSRAGKLKEAFYILETMPYEPDALIWGSILHACGVDGDLRLTERVAERMMELEPQSSLPYMVLAKAYEMRGRWESLVRVKKVARERGVKKVVGCSWVGIKDRVFVFKANQIVHHGGTETYSILSLLVQDMENEGYV